jgi:hypothetical protein
MRVFAAVMTILVASACTRAHVRMDPAGATYTGIFDAPVTLVEGRFEGAPYVPGGASRPVVMLLAEPRASGDLTGDAEPERAVVLAADSGGSGTFVYLAVLGRDGRTTANLATAYLGDRVRVSALRIDSGALEARMLAHAPGDPGCCPSEQLVRRWRLAGGVLVELE